MDRRRTGSPVYGRQWSGGSSSSGSPSPAHPQSRLQPAVSSIKRNQNVAAKAAAQRLAQVMATQTAAGTGDDEDDDDQEDDLLPLSPNRSPSPALGRNFVEHAASVRSTSAGRPSTMSVRTTTLMPPSRPSVRTPVSIPPIEPPTHRNRDKRFSSDISLLNTKDAGDQREASALRDEVSASLKLIYIYKLRLDMLQEENDSLLDKLRHAEERREESEARARELEKQLTPCQRLMQRLDFTTSIYPTSPILSKKSNLETVSPQKTLYLQAPLLGWASLDAPTPNKLLVGIVGTIAEKRNAPIKGSSGMAGEFRFGLGFGRSGMADMAGCFSWRRCVSRSQTVEHVGLAISCPVVFLNVLLMIVALFICRKEAALRQREAALKAAKQKTDGKDGEVVALRSEIQNLKDEAATAVEQLQEAESETKALRSMTQRMILTQEEMFVHCI
ncbi:hypothetical protein Pint_01263 [Pistacia integerrima]|uniref:Uncharacterized protein n=1 Tax=Pistacia integerrima TaxID=434235 RepID=A0ACC0ZM93_9ROSI|nr:hypothetical protein Pint_01263 [Pistacia integerrima]